MEKQLTTRQKIFVESYLVTNNAYRSALKAGYSESTARTGLGRLLHSPLAAEFMEQRQNEIAHDEAGTGRVRTELECIAYADMEDFAQVQEGRVVVKDTAALPPEKKAALAGLKEGTKGVEVKLYDKMRALELLGKMEGLFSAKAREEAQGKAFTLEVKVVDDLLDAQAENREGKHSGGPPKK